jgi:hypothetical protein
MTKLFGIVIVVGLLAAGGCKKKEDGKAQPGGQPAAAAGGKSVGACDRREKEHVCGEYRGAAKLEWIKEQCKAMGAPFVESCPKEGAAGRCANEVGTPMEVHTVYYAPMTKETVTAMCKPPMQLSEP